MLCWPFKEQQMQQYMEDEMVRFSVYTSNPLSIFKFPALASNIHHRRSIFEAQLHFSRWTIQLKIVGKTTAVILHNPHLSFLRSQSFKPSSCVYFLKIFPCSMILQLGNSLMGLFHLTCPWHNDAANEKNVYLNSLCEGWTEMRICEVESSSGWRCFQKTASLVIF